MGPLMGQLFGQPDIVLIAKGNHIAARTLAEEMQVIGCKSLLGAVQLRDLPGIGFGKAMDDVWRSIGGAIIA